MFDSGPFDGLLYDGSAGGGAPLPPLILAAALSVVLLSPDDLPFGIDPEQTFEPSPDDLPFGIDPEQTSLYWY